MRTFVRVLLIALLVSLGVNYGGKYLLRGLSLSAAHAVPGFKNVKIGPAGLWPLSLHEISFDLVDSISVKIQKIALRNTIGNIFSGYAGDIIISDAEVDIHNTKFERSKGFLTGADGNIPFNNIVLEGIKIRSEAPDARFECRATLCYNVSDKWFRAASVDVGIADISGLKLRQVRIVLPEGGRMGYFDIGRVSREKIRAEWIKGQAGLKPMGVFFKIDRGEFCGGTMKGAFSASAYAPPSYEGSFSLSDADLSELSDEMEVKNKFILTGRVSGTFNISGNTDSPVEVVTGRFTASKEGGILYIKDEKILGDIAKAGGGNIDLVMEGFKNYAYTEGDLDIDTEGTDMVMNAVMDGPAGKRRLEMVLHDFKKGD